MNINSDLETFDLNKCETRFNEFKRMHDIYIFNIYLLQRNEINYLYHLTVHYIIIYDLLFVSFGCFSPTLIMS